MILIPVGTQHLTAVAPGAMYRVQLRLHTILRQEYCQTTHFRRRVNSASCDPEYSNPVIVTVNPLPVASIAGTGFVCPGDAATVTVTVTIGESPYTVVLSDGTTVSNYISGSPITVNPRLPLQPIQ